MINLTAILKDWHDTCTIKSNYIYRVDISALKLNYKIEAFVGLLNNIGNMFIPFKVTTNCKA